MTHFEKTRVICAPLTAKRTNPFFFPYLIGAVFSLLLASSCKKDKQFIAPPPEPENPAVTIFNYGNRVIHYTGNGSLIDITGDGKGDVLFDLYLVGDPIEKTDKWRWTVVTSSRTYLAIDLLNEIPVLSKDSIIPLEDFEGYEWYPANEGNLMERKEHEDGRITWSGKWLNVTKKYIAVSPIIDGKRYNAWIEISTNSTAQTLTIHRAGVSKVPDVAIKAGK